MAERQQPALSDSQRKQLRVLKAVYDDPTITAFWRGEDCDALVTLGYAERIDYSGILVVHITPAGVEAANALNASQDDVS